MKILPLRLGTFLTCHLSKATSFSLVLFSLRNLAAMNKKSTTSNCAGSHYFPITQWVPSIRRLCYTVDGNQKSGSPIEGQVVEIPLFTGFGKHPNGDCEDLLQHQAEISPSNLCTTPTKAWKASQHIVRSGGILKDFR